MRNIDELSFCYSVKYKSDKSYKSDYSLSPRPCHNLVFMLEGSGTIISDGQILKIKAKDILFIPQNATYISNWIADKKCVFHSVHFKFNLSKDPFYGKKAPIQVVKTDDFELLYKKVEIIQKYQHSKGVDAIKCLSAFYSLCEVAFNEVIIKDERVFETSVSPAVAYLETNYDKAVKIETLASLCHLSPSRFFYLFKKHVGESPIIYKNKIAVNNAKQALFLHKDKSIDTIAFEHGFSSTIYFRRLFKKLTGKTPSEFRKQESLI